MADLFGFWAELPALAQNIVVLLALLAPALLAGVVVLRGLASWSLVRAMLSRFRGANLVFIGLIALSVGVGVGLTAQERGLRQGSAYAAEKFDLIVGAPGSEITLMLAAVYLQPSDVGLLTGEQFAKIAAAEHVEMAAPIAFGDSYNGAPIVGTTAEFVAHLSGGLAEGRLFTTETEAVAGAYAAVALGDNLVPAHGHGHGHGADAHDGAAYTATGRMPPTGSPWDRAVLVPIEGVWEVHGLANGHAPEANEAEEAPRTHAHAHAHGHSASHIGPPFDPAYFPGTPAVLVRANALWAHYAFKSQFTNSETMAFFPGTVLSQLYAVMGDIRAAMSILAMVTQVLVTVAVLAGLMILTRIYARGLALLRALGAPVRFAFAVVWGYSASLIFVGALFGLAIGYVAAMVLSWMATARTDIVVHTALGWPEFHLVAGFISLTLLLGLLPAWAAVRRPLMPDLR